jgi:hypothetical protein
MVDNFKQDIVSDMTNNINKQIVIEEIHKNPYSLVFEWLNIKQILSCHREKTVKYQGLIDLGFDNFFCLNNQSLQREGF